MRRRQGLVAAALLLGVLSFSGGALAATITVNTTDDSLAADGKCSLREAVNAANADAGGDCVAGSGSDTIALPAGTFKLTIAGASEDANATGDLDLASTITIAGAGAGATIVDGNHVDRVFDVAGAKTVVLQGLTITGGRTPDGGNGGVRRGGGGQGGGP